MAIMAQEDPLLGDREIEEQNSLKTEKKRWPVLLFILISLIVIGTVVLVIMTQLNKVKHKHYDVSNSNNKIKHSYCNCEKTFSNIKVKNGVLSCKDDIVLIDCSFEFKPGWKTSINCRDITEMTGSLQCTRSYFSEFTFIGSTNASKINSTSMLVSDEAAATSTKSGKSAQLAATIFDAPLSVSQDHEENYIILAGGEESGGLVNRIQLFPSSSYSSCLPNLPKELKWGNMGLLGNDLLLCGGQNRAAQPSRTCWILDKRNREKAVWKKHSNLTSPRSQSASAVFGDGPSLSIISGYSRIETGLSIPSMQIVGLQGPWREQNLALPKLDEEQYCSRMASAVTLSSNQILVTGGKGREQSVFLLSGPDLSTWTRKTDMHQARIGHSSVLVTMLEHESVLVAGGWDATGQPSDQVELFSVGEDNWQVLDPLPSPRVDFTLQVLDQKIIAVGGYYSKGSLKFYPGVATIFCSSSGTWSKWSQDRSRKKGKNGFMAAKVSHSWVKQICAKD